MKFYLCSLKEILQFSIGHSMSLLNNLHIEHLKIEIEKMILKWSKFFSYFRLYFLESNNIKKEIKPVVNEIIF